MHTRQYEVGTMHKRMAFVKISKPIYTVYYHNYAMSRRLKRTNLFSKDVSSLLYAYGDVPQPLQSTVHCLDEVVAQYLVDICASAVHTSQTAQRPKVRLEDFKFALRHDPVKLGRAEELIATNKVITEAKKQFNEADNSALKRFGDGTGNDGNPAAENDGDGEGEDEDDDDQDSADETRTSPVKKSTGPRPKTKQKQKAKKQKV